MSWLQAIAIWLGTLVLFTVTVWLGTEVAFRLHVRREVRKFDRYVTEWRARN